MFYIRRTITFKSLLFWKKHNTNYNQKTINIIKNDYRKLESFKSIRKLKHIKGHQLNK